MSESIRVNESVLCSYYPRGCSLGIGPPRRLSEGIRGASFDVVQAAGHAITLEQPLTSAARITEFLKGLSGA